jgi:precorrin-6A/cobalt-precorrin-6A reductase
MKVLLLAGTTEARELADLACSCNSTEVVASLAGHTADPITLPCETRIGGFGGIDGLTCYLTDHEIDVVVDATHAFADDMPRHAVAAACAIAIPHARLVRPPWSPQPVDNWIDADDIADAARLVGELPVTRVLLTIGRLDLREFAGRPSVEFVVRTVEPPGQWPFRPLATIQARGPFSVQDEADFIAKHRIELLVTKNSGGNDAKLVAARSANIPVVMVRRPNATDAVTFENARDAFDWLTSLRA